MQEGIAIIIISIFMATDLHLPLNFLYAYEGEPKWGDILIEKCVIVNSSYFYMRVSNATECDGIVKWYDTHNWQFVTENSGEIILTFENNMTAKEKVFEEGEVENK